MPMINRKACAGTLESSDVYVELEPSVSGIELNLESLSNLAKLLEALCSMS